MVDPRRPLSDLADVPNAIREIELSRLSPSSGPDPEKRGRPRADPSIETLILEAGRASQGYWRDIWRYRELAYFLALRDVLVRYKQTAIGIAWAVIRPVLTAFVLTWVFSKGAQLKTSDRSIPYVLWVYVAAAPWQFFADGLTAASNSLVSNANMISKVYFPRMLMPISRIFVSFLDFLVASLILVLLVVVYHFSVYHFSPSWTVLFMPAFLLMAFAASLACGVWFATLNVQYRDFTYLVPFLVTFGIYVSPVGISSDQFVRSGWLRVAYSLNPMVGVLDGFRWCLFGARAPLYWPGQVASFTTILLVLFTGLCYFRRFERTFADSI